MRALFVLALCLAREVGYIPPWEGSHIADTFALLTLGSRLHRMYATSPSPLLFTQLAYEHHKGTTPTTPTRAGYS